MVGKFRSLSKYTEKLSLVTLRLLFKELSDYLTLSKQALHAILKVTDSRTIRFAMLLVGGINRTYIAASYAGFADSQICLVVSSSFEPICEDLIHLH